MTPDERARFVDFAADIRAELHRYCSRMMGSVFDGEDIVQEALTRAYDALAELHEPPKLRPWLFRIAHNTAMDKLKRYDRRHVDVVADVPERAAGDEVDVDAPRLEIALAVFTALPPLQRSALALKDVLGLSLEETAATIGTTTGAVKAALHRARATVAVKRDEAVPIEVDRDALDRLRRYAHLFNARDWDGLRAVLTEDAHLDLVSRARARGLAARVYYRRYSEIAERTGVRLAVGHVDGVLVLAAFEGDPERPAYFIQLQWEGDRVAAIRDFRYATYVTESARFSAIEP